MPKYGSLDRLSDWTPAQFRPPSLVPPTPTTDRTVVSEDGKTIAYLDARGMPVVPELATHAKVWEMIGGEMVMKVIELSEPEGQPRPRNRMADWTPESIVITKRAEDA